MFKKLILSLLLFISVFTFTSSVQAEEKDSTASLSLLGEYLDDDSMEYLKDSYMKSELSNMEAEYMQELLENIVTIESPSKTDAKILTSAISGLEEANKYTDFYISTKDLVEIKEDLKDSMYPKAVKDSQVEQLEEIITDQIIWNTVMYTCIILLVIASLMFVNAAFS